jgi:hypothetical protein
VLGAVPALRTLEPDRIGALLWLPAPRRAAWPRRAAARVPDALRDADDRRARA